MTDTFDPTRPCKRKNGQKIVQLVKLERPIHGSEEEWMALDESGEVSFNYNDGRVFTVSRDSRDLVNTPEEVEVVRWGLIRKDTGMFQATYSIEEDMSKWSENWHVVRMTGSYTR